MKPEPNPVNEAPTDWLTQIATLTVPLAAFLGFAIQLILAKQLLPLYGGSPAVWLGSSIYFQFTLVAGYAWALWLLRRPVRTQAWSCAVLAVIAALTFHLPQSAVNNPTIGWVVLRLALSSLPAMLLLFSASPLLHGWVERRAGTLPYHLYALSNGGSLLALLAYPFLIEANLDLGIQGGLWHTLLFLTAALFALAAHLLWRRSAASPVSAESEPAVLLASPWPRMLAWFALGALGVFHSLGATYQLAGEIGSIPLAWSGPLGLYLLGFACAFSGRWTATLTRLLIALLALSLTGYMLVKGFTPATIAGARLGWLLALAAAGGFLTAALLHHLKPDRRPEVFYLLLGLGGAAGGLGSTYLVPWLFPIPIELAFTSLALLLAGLGWMLHETHLGRGLTLAVVVATPILGIGYHQLAQRSPELHALHLRDSNGSILLEASPQGVVLSSETTTHGSQLTADATARKRPTTYYSESSGVGRTLTKLQAERPALRYGVIGLGAGTLATYARPTDICDFWDIDPKSLRVAREFFSYLGDASGKINVHLQDGRKALEASTDAYDVIVLDAFSGDYIPAHLVTREALDIYFKRLRDRDGRLVIHISSRFSDYYPIVAATARTLGIATIKVSTDITGASETEDWDAARTDYLVLCRPRFIRETLAWFPATEAEGRVTRVVLHQNTPDINPAHIWTDQRNASINVLKINQLLQPQ